MVELTAAESVSMPVFKGQHDAATATSIVNTNSTAAMMRGSHTDFARKTAINYYDL